MTDRLDNVGTPMINPDGTVMSFQEATDALNAGKKDPNKVGGIESPDPNKKPEGRVYISVLDNLVSLVNENPRYTIKDWDVHDTLMRLLTFGLRLEDSQIDDKPIPPVIGHAPLG